MTRRIHNRCNLVPTLANSCILYDLFVGAIADQLDRPLGSFQL